jgi:RNA polymerase-binding transcription factor
MTRENTARERLLALEQEYADRLERIRQNVQRGFSSDSEERAKEMEDQDVVDALGNETRVTLEKVRAALRRLDAGNYGSCRTCGGTIQAERLEAFPYAERCIECARDADG